ADAERGPETGVRRQRCQPSIVAVVVRYISATAQHDPHRPRGLPIAAQDLDHIVEVRAAAGRRDDLVGLVEKTGLIQPEYELTQGTKIVANVLDALRCAVGSQRALE